MFRHKSGNWGCERLEIERGLKKQFQILQTPTRGTPQQCVIFCQRGTLAGSNASPGNAIDSKPGVVYWV